MSPFMHEKLKNNNLLLIWVIREFLDPHLFFQRGVKGQTHAVDID